MKGLLTAIWAEGLKARRSKIFIVTICIFIFIGLMMGVLLLLSRHPELVGRETLLATKASTLSVRDWNDFMNLGNMVAVMMGMMGFGFVTSWIFGREFSDRTVKDILALPVPRHNLVWAKLGIGFVWSLILALVYFIVALCMGLVIGLPGGSPELILSGFATYFLAALLTTLLSPLIAFFASWGRGYLLPIGVIILCMIITNFLANVLPEVSAYVPWAIPALLSGAAGPDRTHLEAVSFVILGGTCALGIAATIAWWRHADQT
jgi:ABC-2 type transport system permease protein